MSELTDKLINMALSHERELPIESKLLRTAADTIADLERKLITQEKLLDGNAAVESAQRSEAYCRAELNSLKTRLDDIAKACEFTGSQKDIVLRVAALHQQSKAMTRICEDHIKSAKEYEQAAKDSARHQAEAVSHLKAERANTCRLQDFVNAFVDASGVSRDCYKGEDDKLYAAAVQRIRDLQGANRTLDAALVKFQEAAGGASDTRGLFAYGADVWPRRILDNLRTKAENRLREQWQLDKTLEAVAKFEKEVDVRLVQPNNTYARINLLRGFCVDKIQELKETVLPTKAHLRDLEANREVLEKIKNRIAAANGALDIKSADPLDYVRQLEYLIDEIWRYRRLWEGNKETLERITRTDTVEMEKLAEVIGALYNAENVLQLPNSNAAKGAAERIHLILGYVQECIDAKGKLVGQLADAKRSAEARQLTLAQLAAVLKVSPGSDGWCTHMLNRAQTLVRRDEEGYSRSLEDRKADTAFLKDIVRSIQHELDRRVKEAGE